jgi:hypothetical protein
MARSGAAGALPAAAGRAADPSAIVEEIGARIAPARRAGCVQRGRAPPESGQAPAVRTGGRGPRRRRPGRPNMARHRCGLPAHLGHEAEGGEATAIRSPGPAGRLHSNDPAGGKHVQQKAAPRIPPDPPGAGTRVDPATAWITPSARPVHEEPQQQPERGGRSPDASANHEVAPKWRTTSVAPLLPGRRPPARGARPGQACRPRSDGDARTECRPPGTGDRQTSGRVGKPASREPASVIARW